MNHRTIAPSDHRTKIISGGQTGVDRAALDVALELGLPCGGWCPKGRKAEDGPIDSKYPLKETDSPDYEVRTEWNVRDSDATLIITHGKPTGGTAYTIAMARVHKKPCLVVDLCHCEGEARSLPCLRQGGQGNPVNQILQWFSLHNVRTLNIAGPRESNSPGIYKEAKALFLELL